MTVCSNRPHEEPGFFTPCAGRVDGATRTCVCGSEVRSDVAAGDLTASGVADGPVGHRGAESGSGGVSGPTSHVETRVARVPDSAREAAS